ncbi:MAG: hypothetical protein M3320_00340 [Actinomycetota bacterium]|nr:hypothetical protein [Actinomycetota bacterium]
MDEEWHFDGKVTSDLPMVSFVDGQVQPYGVGGLVEEDVDGRYTRHEEDTWSGPDSLTCDSDSEPTPGGRSGIDPVTVDGGYEGVAVRVVDTLPVTGDCDDGRSPGSTILAVFSEDDEIALDAFDARFDVPEDAVGSGQIAQLVSGGAAGTECPGFEPGITQSCQVRFEGVVTFTRSDFTGEVDPVEQLPAPDPGPPTNPYDPIKAVQDAIEDHLDTERIADSIKEAFQQHSNSAKVEMTCPGACSGSVKASAQGAGGAAPRRMVARLRFDRRTTGWSAAAAR